MRWSAASPGWLQGPSSASSGPPPRPPNPTRCQPTNSACCPLRWQPRHHRESLAASPRSNCHRVAPQLLVVRDGARAREQISLQRPALPRRRAADGRYDGRGARQGDPAHRCPLKSSQPPLQPRHSQHFNSSAPRSGDAMESPVASLRRCPIPSRTAIDSASPPPPTACSTRPARRSGLSPQ